MSELVSTPLAQQSAQFPPPIPGSALPNGGSRPLADDVFQSAEEAVLVQSAAPEARGATSPEPQPPGAFQESGGAMHLVRSQVAARPCEAALLAAGAGALAMWALRRSLRGRFGSY
jgi:hypothetical protein